MTVTRINHISEFEGQIVQLNGWVYNSRRSGKIGFLMLRDGFGLIQCIVAKNDVGEEKFELFKSLTQESSLSVNGKVVKNDRALGGFELVLSDLTLYQLSSEYPITPKEHGTDFLMNHRHLWLRSKRQIAILRVRHEIIKAVRDFFDSNDFTLCDSPIFTPNAAEGTSTLFETDYFGKTAYLAQTGQLYGEAMNNNGLIILFANECFFRSTKIFPPLKINTTLIQDVYTFCVTDPREWDLNGIKF